MLCWGIMGDALDRENCWGIMGDALDRENCWGIMGDALVLWTETTVGATWVML